MSLDFLTLTAFRDEQVLTNPDFAGFYPYAISPNQRYVLCNASNTLWTLDRSDESTIEATTYDPASFDSFSGAAIDDDGTIYAIQNLTVLGGFDSLIKFDDFGRGAKTVLSAGINQDVSRTFGLFVMPNSAKWLVWAEGVDAYDIKLSTIAGSISTVANVSGIPIQQIVQDSYGDVWAVTSDTSNVYFQRVINGGAGTAAPDSQTIAVSVASTIGIQIYHSSAGWFVCHNQGIDLYLIDDADFSILAHRTYGSGIGNTLNFPLYDQPPFLLGLTPGATSFWFPSPDSYSATFGIPADGYVGVDKINAADLTTIDTHALTDWPVGDTFSIEAGLIYTGYGREALASNWSGEFIPVLRYFPLADGGPGNTDDDIRLRVWTFSLDGHDYFVLRIGITETLVYDLTTSQWSHWASPSEEIWRAHVGQNWIGIGPTTVARGFGTDIVAGDDRTGILWMLDPSVGLDDDPVDGEPAVPFERKVTGGIQLSGRETRPCGAIQLTTAMGSPEYAGASYTLRISDDHGNSWLDCGSVSLASGTFSGIVEWRGLGLMKAPGRVFEVSDSGASVRLSRLDLR